MNAPSLLKYGRTLAEQWLAYETHVLPATAGALQRTETRRGFYAGAQALFEIILRRVSDEPEMTEDDEQLMRGLQGEIDQFVQDVREGRA